MIKLKLVNAVGLLALMAGTLAQADVIVDTGLPNQSGPQYMLSDAQWLASEFSISQASTINNVAGFITADSANPDSATFTIAVYSGNLNTDSEVFARQANFVTDGWNGLQGISLNLNAGDYWLAFEVRQNDSLQGLMPVVAPKTLATAFNDVTTNFGYKPITADYNLAVQVSSVPLPPSVMVFASGLLVFFRAKRNKTPA